MLRANSIHLHKSKPPTFLSLFSGAGGLDFGFHEQGFRCLGAMDNDPIAVETYNANHGDFCRLVDLNDSSFPLTPSRVDVLVAGPPCQGFSTVGKRDTSDPRNQLISQAVDLGLRQKAKVVIIENVPAAVSGAHSSHWVSAEERLREAGYTVRRILMCGLEVGISQARRRLFLIAWRGRHRADFLLQRVSPKSLGEVLRGVSSLSDHEPIALKAGSVNSKIAARIGQGQRLCDVRKSPDTIHTWDIPEVFGRTDQHEKDVLLAVMRLRRRDRVRDFGDGDPVSLTRLDIHLGKTSKELVCSLVTKGFLKSVEGGYDLRRTFNGKFRRPRFGGVAPTVDTHFGDPTIVLHPLKSRGFTVREAARIQGFPDKFRFSGSRGQNFRLIGNAVPPNMSRQVAHWVKELLG